ncbi:MAG: TVP38/TMEM64 family protein [Desulfomonile tiedjei]|nr:TVP38/TMEM64 family protein [Desulfomonile tiedjei]
MRISTRKEAVQLAVAVVLLACTALGIVWLWRAGYLVCLVDDACDVLVGKDELRIYVQSWGRWAPLVFIAIQSLQVVLAPIPGELTGAVGGFIFGALPNVLYSTIGLTVGSIGAFAGGRLMGAPLVKLVVSRETWERFRFLTERKGTFIALVLFTIPGFPKDVLCYILGLSPMGFFPFLIVCAVGRLPGTIMLSYSGSALYDENWLELVAWGVACGALLVLVWLCRDRINRWIHKHAGHHDETERPPETGLPSADDVKRRAAN